MKSRGLPAICLGPAGNIQGTYSFLNLSVGLVIKCLRFTELPAPDSVIKRVATLAEKSNVSTNLVFANRHKITFDWPDTDLSTTLDLTPMVVFPSMPAEMPGVLLLCHVPDTDANDDELDGLPEYSNTIDWSQLANDAAKNADLDVTEHLSPPSEVIKIDDTDYVYVPPVTPILKQEPNISTPTDPPTQSSSPTTTSISIPSRTRTPHVSQIPPPSTSSRVSTWNRRLPSHLDDYHVFTIVTEERHQPPEHPYHTAGGTDVDLATLDEERMAYLCHFVMVHTATSLALAQHGQPTKKQCGLKTGLKWFGSRGDTTVTKELSQLHTLNCFRLCDPSSLTRDDQCNALSSLMFLTEKCSGKVKARACANGSVQRKHVAKDEAVAPTVTSEAIFVQSTIYAH